MQQRDVKRLAALLVEHRQRRGWTGDAACHGMPFDDFFGDEPTEAARAACASCPVILDCLVDEVGIDADDLHGYRAGLKESVRRRVMAEATRLRPSDWDERKKRVLSAVAAGVPVTQAAANEGISRRTAQRWLAA
jgi:hypothetical protein